MPENTTNKSSSGNPITPAFDFVCMVVADISREGDTCPTYWPSLYTSKVTVKMGPLWVVPSSWPT